MLTNIYECLAITLRSWRSLCDHCELMVNGIRKPILHTFATGETSITFETPQKRPRMLTNRYECLAIICDHCEFMANCIRKPIFAIYFRHSVRAALASKNRRSVAFYNNVQAHFVETAHSCKWYCLLLIISIFRVSRSSGERSHPFIRLSGVDYGRVHTDDSRVGLVSFRFGHQCIHIHIRLHRRQVASLTSDHF